MFSSVAVLSNLSKSLPIKIAVLPHFWFHSTTSGRSQSTLPLNLRSQAARASAQAQYTDDVVKIGVLSDMTVSSRGLDHGEIEPTVGHPSNCKSNSCAKTTEKRRPADP
jgi:hypothetical protein